MIKTKVFRVLKRSNYEERLNDFLKTVEFVDMKIVPESSDHAFDIIILYRNINKQEETKNDN